MQTRRNARNLLARNSPDSGDRLRVGEGYMTRRCRRITYLESYMTMYATYTKTHHIVSRRVAETQTRRNARDLLAKTKLVLFSKWQAKTRISSGSNLKVLTTFVIKMAQAKSRIWH
jgi:hypothetical protein